MNAPKDNITAKGLREWWASPQRPGIAPPAQPMGVRHPAPLGSACRWQRRGRRGRGCLWYDDDGWSGFFQILGTLNLAGGSWYLTIARGRTCPILMPDGASIAFGSPGDHEVEPAAAVAWCLPSAYICSLKLVIFFKKLKYAFWMASWGFLTTHARVLLCIAHDPGARLRDIAASLGITERTAHGIVTDLAEAGYVVKQKDGRRNRYQIQAHLPLRGPGSREPTVGEVVALFAAQGQARHRGRPGE